MRTDILLLIAGMTLVTYIPRMLPAVLLEKLHFGTKVEKFLQLIPYVTINTGNLQAFNICLINSRIVLTA